MAVPSKKVETESIELDVDSGVVVNTNAPLYVEPEKPKLSLGARILSFFWDTAADSPEERALVNRLDLGVLIYVTLSYFVKAIDEDNIFNAYVSGMMEDLSLYGNEYNYFTTFFNIGSISMSIPMQMMTFKLRPSIVVPSCELLWTILVFMIPLCKTVKPIYAIRFLIGASQAICYPCFAMLISSWYKPSEMGKRMLLYDGSWAIASMCSGYIQAGVYHTLNGAHGVPGWKWMFIINGCMSLPVAISGFFAIPDFPNNTRALYLTKDMRALALKRMEAIGRVGRRKMTFRRLWDYRKEWRLYAFTFPYCIFICSGAGKMSLWLKSLGTYSVEMINILPTIKSAIGFVMAYVYGVISDLTYWRWQLFCVAVFFEVFGNFLLAIWNIPFGLKFAAFIIPGFGTPFWGLLMSWGEEVMYDDAELRGLYPAIANAFYYALTAWVPVLVFPASKAPRYNNGGYWIATALIFSASFSVPLIIYLQRRDLKKKGLKLNRYNIPVPIEDYEALRYTKHMDHEAHNAPVIEQSSIEITDEDKIQPRV